MRYCNKCKVIIENDLDDCPLCKQKTLKRNEVPENDFPIQKIAKENVFNTIMKVLLFMFIALICTNIILYISFSINYIWAPYAIVALFYAYLILRTAMRSYRNIGTIVMINVYMLSIMSIILDVILGFQRWSVNYIIPILVIAGIISLVIFICIKPTNFLTYFIYMLIIALFGIMLLILLWVHLVTIKIPSVIAAFISFLVIIGMFMFGDKKASNEFVKRFHF